MRLRTGAPAVAMAHGAPAVIPACRGRGPCPAAAVDTHVWALACKYYTPHLRNKSLTKKVHVEVQVGARAAPLGVGGRGGERPQQRT